MAISIQTLRSLIKCISLSDKTKFNIATIGYPDCLFSRDQVEGVLGDGFCDDIPIREDGEEILKWHNLDTELDAIYETRAFLRQLGISVTIFDLKKVRGGEIIHDFNKPVTKKNYNQFDMVYDGGTLEHLFNVSQGIINMLLLCKVGGFIIHSNPMNHYNHGFYNFNPTFYHDFYTQNGHEIIGDMEAIKTDKLSYSSAVLPETRIFHGLHSKHTISVTAQKKNLKKPVFPLQTKYILNPTQKVELPNGYRR